MTVARNATQISSLCPTWNSRFACTAVLLTGMLAIGSLAVAQSSLPDAQVESNVLKALAGAPELASESITTRTMYGTVTLSGTVRDESTRRRAENLAANSDGVKKVVDELRLGNGGAVDQLAPGQPVSQQQVQPGEQVLLSDGTYGPAPAGASAAPDGAPAPGTAPAEMAQRNNPDADYQLDQQRDQQAGVLPGTQNGQQSMPVQQPGDQQAQQQPYPNQQQPYSNQQQPYPNQQAQTQPYPNQQQPYPNQQPYPDPNATARRPLNPQGYPYPQPQAYPGYGQQSPNGQPNYAANTQQPNPYGQQPLYGGGQAAGQPVLVPSGSLLRVRVNRPLSSKNTPAGTSFDGIITNDVVSGGVIAIPRGATVQGTVVDSKASAVLKGRGELSIQLTSVSLGGKVYPIVSDLWAHNGGDKTIETINRTAGYGAGGALVGALAGGGEGAAIGAGVGAALGLGSSAASGRGQVFIPAEGVVTFHLAQPAPVQTVSEQEMQRLAYGVPSGADGAARYRRYPNSYPGAYGPYGPPY